MAIKIEASYRLHATSGFEDWSKERQEQYLKEHPNSKYAKGAKPKEKTQVKPKSMPKIKPLSGDKADSKVSDLHDEGYKSKPNPKGNEYSRILEKEGSPTYYVNYRFGTKGETYLSTDAPD